VRLANVRKSQQQKANSPRLHATFVSFLLSVCLFACRPRRVHIHSTLAGSNSNHQQLPKDKHNIFQFSTLMKKLKRKRKIKLKTQPHKGHQENEPTTLLLN